MQRPNFIENGPFKQGVVDGSVAIAPSKNGVRSSTYYRASRKAAKNNINERVAIQTGKDISMSVTSLLYDYQPEQRINAETVLDVVIHVIINVKSTLVV